MTSLERVQCTLSGKIPDRVPMFDFLFQKPLFTEMIGVTPGDYSLVQAVDCARALNLDMTFGIAGAAENFECVTDGDGKYRDEFGTLRVRRGEVSWPIDAPVEFPIKDEDDFKKFKFPDPYDKGRFKDLHDGIVYNGGDLAVCSGVDGPFTTVWMLMGPEELLVQMHTDPDFIKEMLNKATDYLIEIAKGILKEKPAMFSIAEDLGASAGSFISPEMFREFVRPVLERMMDVIDIPVFFHSCGNITNLLDDIVDLGIALIHPLQRTANMDIAYVKEKYGERLTIAGNIDSSRTLPYGSPEDVEKEVRETMKIAKPGGRYILASDHSLHDGIPVENIKRLFKTGLETGVYSH
jgi:uroporphyrinogen decarboxylase